MQVYSTRCLSDFSPDATSNFYGDRVERTGCLDQGFVLPLSNEYVKLTRLRIENARCRHSVGWRFGLTEEDGESSRLVTFHVTTLPMCKRSRENAQKQVRPVASGEYPSCVRIEPLCWIPDILRARGSDVHSQCGKTRRCG